MTNKNDTSKISKKSSVIRVLTIAWFACFIVGFVMCKGGKTLKTNNANNSTNDSNQLKTIMPSSKSARSNVFEELDLDSSENEPNKLPKVMSSSKSFIMEELPEKNKKPNLKPDSSNIVVPKNIESIMHSSKSAPMFPIKSVKIDSSNKK